MTYPYVAGAVLLASDLNTDFAAKTDLAMTQNAQTGTTYSFALADASKLLTTSNASPVSVTVTKQATVTWVTGTQLRIMNIGAGVTTLVADTGVTINGNVALKQYQGGTLIRTASDVWLFVPTASSSGMDLITPTSVAGSGVTLSGGEVSFSAATAVSVNGCFTTTYDAYMIVTQLAQSADNTIALRMRAAGTDASGANYDYQFGLISGTATFARYTGQTSGNIGYAFSDYAGTITVTSPALAAITYYGLFGAYGPPIATNLIQGRHTLTTAYDGFTLLPGSGNLTGTLRVYGLRKS